jgi:phage-related protein
MKITSEEYRDIVRWLNRHTFHRLRFLSDDEYEPCYYNASFNVNKITIDNVLYGIELGVETDSPFGFGAEIHEILELSKDKEVIVKDISDEIGSISPTIKITCPEEEITIKNITLGTETIITGCSEGEIITIDGNTHTVSSSISGRKETIYDNFNYDYFKLGNTIDNRDNIIKASDDCILEIIYRPTIKWLP